MKSILSSKWGKMEICAGLFGLIGFLAVFLALTISNTKFLNHIVQAQENAATVTTNQADYSADDMALITGSGWQPGETVTLEIVEDPVIHDPDTLYAVADADGNISNEYIIHGHDVVQTFTLTASGMAPNVGLQTTFTNSLNPTSTASLPTTPTTDATVMTDKSDYIPGETVLITGSGWWPGETVALELVEEPLIHPAETLYAIADADGNITNAEYVIQEHDLGQSFTLTATGQTSGLIAQTTFTDASLSAAPLLIKESTCVTNTSTFTLGQTVCASTTVTVTGGGALPDVRIQWYNPSNTLVQDTLKSGVSDGSTQTDTFIPNVTGTWTVKTCKSSGAGSCSVGNTMDTKTFAVVQCSTNADCNDSNVCTTDTCVSNLCVFTNNADSCDDGNACTTSDTCSGGSCGGTPITCNDDNICTDDSCDPATGCVYTPNNSACDDSNACTESDTCSGGSCGGTPITCNDDNICTDDSCDPATGCVFTPGNAGTVCNPGSGDLCDPDETCDGVSAVCPADTIAPATTICNPGSGDICDPDESCTGVADAACPTDNIAPATTVCNPGSGDICDPDESCTGVADAACPADVVAPPDTVCNPSINEFCDVDELCTGVADQACPDDVVKDYYFVGFLSPTDNPPVFNMGNAGRTYPIKWQLPDCEGGLPTGGFVSDLDVVGGIDTYRVMCDASSPMDPMEAETSGNSGLHYDFVNNQFIFNWKTSRTFANKCYELRVTFDNDEMESAYFDF